MKRTELHSSFVSTVQQFVIKKRLLRQGQTVIAAVSGGVDSMVMLHVLNSLQNIWKLNIVVAHVNYQLRGKDSTADELFVKKQAKQYRIPFYTIRTDTKKTARDKKYSLQQTARDIRYEFFESIKTLVNADVIVTAHHADDNAETVFLNLVRGSGIEGLAGIPCRRDTIIRPLLCVTRKEIEQYAKDNAIAFRVDSTNAGNDYSRNFLRNSIIPVLQERINPSLTQTLRRESELFREAADFIGSETKKAVSAAVHSKQIDAAEMKKLHPFMQQSVVRSLLMDLKIEPTSTAIHSIVELLEQQKGNVVEAANDWIAERTADSVLFRKKSGSSEFAYVLKHPGRVSTGNFTITVKKSAVPDNKVSNDASKVYADASKVTFPVIVRSWKSGDHFKPLGLHGTKKLSDFLGGLKLSAEEKLSVPVIESGGVIMWVAGKRLDDRFKLTDSSHAAYQLTIKPNGKKNHHR